MSALDQSTLRTLAAARIRIHRPDLARQYDLGTSHGLAHAAEEILGAAEPVVIAVIRRVDLGEWIRETCRMAVRLQPATAAAWQRGFTRTVLLAGNPANLSQRFAFDHIGARGDIAWYGPDRPGSAAELRRLLKLFAGRRAVSGQTGITVTVPGADGMPPTRLRSRRLYLATARVTLADAMIHLHHLVAEAVLDGTLVPGDRLRLEPVPTLGDVPPLSAVRVAGDPAHPGRLRAYAGLTEELPHV